MKNLFLTVLLALGLGFAQVPRLQIDSSNLVTVGNICELANAVSNANDGRTIVLRDGNYNMTSFGTLNVRASNVTLVGQSFDPTRVIIRGSGFTSPDNGEELIKVFRPNFRIAHLTIRDVRANGLKVQVDSCNNLLVHNVRFIDITERSIKVPANYQNGFEVRFCHFEQVSPITDNIPNLYDDGNYIAGMDVMRTNNIYIHDNTFLNIRGRTGGGRAAVFLWNGCRNVLIERNTFIGCDRSISLGNPSGPTNDTVNAVIRNNFVVAGSGIALENARTFGVKIFHNSVFRTNPTYYRTVMNFESGNVELRNNILFGGINETNVVGTVQSGNLTSTSLNDTSWFIGYQTGNLRIGLNSFPNRRNLPRLVDVLTDFDGKSRSDSTDVGAFEGPYNPPPIDTTPPDTGNGGPQLRACRDR